MATEADLIKYGFIKKDEKGNILADMEKDEESRNVNTEMALYNTPTGYPKPLRRYRLYVEGYNVSLEEPYFWVLNYLRHFCGYTQIDKITDVFAAAETSAFFGSAQQKLGLQQDKISQFLASVGKMVKELFQLVRELRILDERLGYYYDSYTDSPSSESAEITLKGIWIDMVEQGAKNPASVYGMAREVQFTTLPDLFFSTHPKKQEDVDKVVDTERAEFNRKVREVLKRKLRSFLAWKEHTFEELKNRRKFTLKYLRQHYEIIRMYLNWVKPYLKNVQRLQMDQTKIESPDLVAAFETTLIEVELLAKKPAGKVNEVILIHFWFRSRPELSYTHDYQRGPVHIGRIQINFRSYAWTDEEIENYKAMRQEEDFRLLGLIDKSIKAAMEALGDELMRYLGEAGEEDLRRVIKKIELKEMPSKLAPKIHIFKNFSELFKPFKAQKKTTKATKELQFPLSKAKSSAGRNATRNMWTTYNHFKKHHGMLSW